MRICIRISKIYIMDLFAIWGTIKYVKYLFKIDKWWHGLVYLFNYYCRFPYHVAVFGTSGAGKTEFVRAIMELPVEDREPDRTNFYKKHRLVFSDGRKIVFIDAPGHNSYKQQRTEVTEFIAKRKIRGIINLVTYGYNDVNENEGISVFKVGENVLPEVKAEYLKTNRENEMKQVEEWRPFVTNKNHVEWVATVVNKADIWHDDKDSIIKYYREGDYYLRCMKVLEQACHLVVYPYCSLISPFGKKKMVISIGEHEKAMMHHSLKSVLLKLVRNEHE